jgi:hypothetical protein
MLVLCYEGTICLVCWKSPQTFVLVSNWLHSTEQNHFYVDAFKQGFSYFQSLLIQSYTSRRFCTDSKLEKSNPLHLSRRRDIPFGCSTVKHHLSGR